MTRPSRLRFVRSKPHHGLDWVAGHPWPMTGGSTGHRQPSRNSRGTSSARPRPRVHHRSTTGSRSGGSSRGCSAPRGCGTSTTGCRPCRRPSSPSSSSMPSCPRCPTCSPCRTDSSPSRRSSCRRRARRPSLDLGHGCDARVVGSRRSEPEVGPWTRRSTWCDRSTSTPRYGHRGCAWNPCQPRGWLDGWPVLARAPWQRRSSRRLRPASRR